MSLKQILRAISPVPRSHFDQMFHDTNWTRFNLLSPDQRRILLSGTDEEASQLIRDLRTRARLSRVDLVPDPEYLFELRNGQG